MEGCGGLGETSVASLCIYRADEFTFAYTTVEQMGHKYRQHFASFLRVFTFSKK